MSDGRSKTCKARRQRRERLWFAQGGRCAACGRTMRRDVGPLHPEAVTIDHVVPKAMGGTYGDNSLLKHKRCNERKACREPTSNDLEWLKRVREWTEKYWLQVRSKVAPSEGQQA